MIDDKFKAEAVKELAHVTELFKIALRTDVETLKLIIRINSSDLGRMLFRHFAEGAGISDKEKERAFKYTMQMMIVTTFYVEEIQKIEVAE